ncbi:unnamed protein product [Rhizophagus irregularis]|nr:unnamed protein product [Rhizophagus irregularis]
MSLTVDWRVELSDDESDSYSDYKDFDNSLFSSFAVHQTANADYSRILIQSSFSSSNITFRAYFPPWQFSTKLFNLKSQFDKDILTQYPCVLCSYCSRLQYPTKARWELYNDTIQYSLEKVYQNNPQIKLVFHTDDSKLKRIATCSSCYNPVPAEIQNVPPYHPNNNSNSWYHSSLNNAATWLCYNNSYFRPYKTLINHGTWDGPPVIFPITLSSNLS